MQTTRLLLLARHATAESHSVPQLDYNRQLHSKGILEATELGQRLAARHIKPDTILSSPAPRALQTAILLAEYLNYASGSIKSLKSLYNPSVQTMLSHLGDVDDSNQTVILVSHNPAVSALVTHLSRHTTAMPSAGLVAIECPVGWRDLSAGSCTYLWHDFPQ